MPVQTTNILSSSDNANIIHVDRDIKAAEKDSFMGLMIGGIDAPIMRVNDLAGAKRGESVRGINIDDAEPKPGIKLTGTDTSQKTAEGLGQPLSVGNIPFSVAYYQTEIKMGHLYQDQYTSLDLMRLKENSLRRWFASQLDGGFEGQDSNGDALTLGYDDGLINKLLGSTAYYLWANPAHDALAGATTNLAAGDTLTVNRLIPLLTAAKTGNYTSTIVGSVSTRKFRRASAMGFTGVFFLIANPELFDAMRQETSFREALSSYIAPKGKNPLWDEWIQKHVLLRWQNIVLVENDRMPIYTNGGGASVRCGKFLLLGAAGGLTGRGMTLRTTVGQDTTKTLTNIYPQLIQGNHQAIPDDTGEPFGCLTGWATTT